MHWCSYCFFVILFVWCSWVLVVFSVCCLLIDLAIVLLLICCYLYCINYLWRSIYITIQIDCRYAINCTVFWDWVFLALFYLVLLQDSYSVPVLVPVPVFRFRFGFGFGFGCLLVCCTVSKEDHTIILYCGYVLVFLLFFGYSVCVI